MSYVLRAKESVIGESLNKYASLVESAGQGAWNFILNNGSMLLVSARADEHWLHLDAALNGGTAMKHDPWQLLKLNQGLGGFSKVALLPGQLTPRVRAEIPLDEEVDLQQRLREACAGLKTAAGKLHGEGVAKILAGESPASPIREKESRVGSSTSATENETRPELKRLCEESGWKFTERAGPKLIVDLETRSGFYQALVEQQEGGAISLKAEMTGEAAFSKSSKQAIGTMLLRASAAIRLARATIKETEEGATASFEALFQTPPCAAEFSHALSALAVGCGLCGQAVEALGDEVVARHYLAGQYSPQELELKLE